MAEVSAEQQEEPPTVEPEVNKKPLISVTVDEDDVEDNQTVEVADPATDDAPISNFDHDHNYKTSNLASVSVGNANYGENGKPFPQMDGLLDYLKDQGPSARNSQPQGRRLMLGAQNDQQRVIRLGPSSNYAAVSYAKDSIVDRYMQRGDSRIAIAGDDNRMAREILNGKPLGPRDIRLESGIPAITRRPMPRPAEGPPRIYRYTTINSRMIPPGTQVVDATGQVQQSPQQQQIVGRTSKIIVNNGKPTYGQPRHIRSPEISNRRPIVRGMDLSTSSYSSSLRQPGPTRSYQVEGTESPQAGSFSQQPSNMQNRTPRILHPQTRRPPPQQQQSAQTQLAVSSQPSIGDDESALIDVVEEEEQRNQKFFQKQQGANNSFTTQSNPINSTSQKPTNVGGISGATTTDPHGYFNTFQSPTIAPPRHMNTSANQHSRQISSTFTNSPSNSILAQQSQVSKSARDSYGQSNSQQLYPMATSQVSTFQEQSKRPNQIGSSSFYAPQTQVGRPRIHRPQNLEAATSPRRTAKTSLPTEQKSKRGRKKKSELMQNAVAEREGVDYVTRCICGMKHDDGNMIECDKCNVWQHIRCMAVPKEILENNNSKYYCEQCEPRELTVMVEDAVQMQEKVVRKQQRDSKRLSAGQPSKSPHGMASAPKKRGPKPKDKNAPPHRQSINGPEIDTPTKGASKTLTGNTRGIRKVVAEMLPGERELFEKLDSNSTPETEIVHSLLVAPGTYGIASKNKIEEGTPIIEYKSTIMLPDERTAQRLKFRSSVVYDVPCDEGAPIRVYADASKHGSLLTSIRKSCQPNAVIRHCVTENDELHLFLVAATQIDAVDEVTIPLDIGLRDEVDLTDFECPCQTYGDKTTSCPVQEFKQNPQQFAALPSAAPVNHHQLASSSPAAQPQRKQRTASPQKPAVNNPSSLSEDLEVATILIHDLPSSDSTTTTAQKTASSSTSASSGRRSPNKTSVSSTLSPSRTVSLPKSAVEKKTTRSATRKTSTNRELANLLSSDFDYTPSVGIADRVKGVKRNATKHLETSTENEPQSPKRARMSIDEKPTTLTTPQQPRGRGRPRTVGIHSEKTTKQKVVIQKSKFAEDFDALIRRNAKPYEIPKELETLMDKPKRANGLPDRTIAT
ncbi:SET domain-containing protein [Aphelenchoides besseyi]|nr:SET domain-containing protein [Aphelenchoides besseyi]